MKNGDRKHLTAAKARSPLAGAGVPSKGAAEARV
jgi:hypothetical protein